MTTCVYFALFFRVRKMLITEDLTTKRKRTREHKAHLIVNQDASKEGAPMPGESLIPSCHARSSSVFANRKYLQFTVITLTIGLLYHASLII